MAYKNKRTLCCNKRSCICDNPIGEVQTKTNRTQELPVAALPDYERLLNLGEVSSYEEYLEIYVKGQPGNTPYVGMNGNWFVEGVDTGVKATGTNGLTPYIGTNGNWWIGSTDTGVNAGGTGSTVSPETDNDIFN